MLYIETTLYNVLARSPSSFPSSVIRRKPAQRGLFRQNDSFWPQSTNTVWKHLSQNIIWEFDGNYFKQCWHTGISRKQVKGVLCNMLYTYRLEAWKIFTIIPNVSQIRIQFIQGQYHHDLKIISHMIESYYCCCCINEPVIFSHCIVCSP